MNAAHDASVLLAAMVRIDSANPGLTEDGPGETLDIVEAEVGALLDRCRRADPDLTVSARTTMARGPFETPAGASIVTALQDASRH